MQVDNPIDKEKSMLQDAKDAEQSWQLVERRKRVDKRKCMQDLNFWTAEEEGRQKNRSRSAREAKDHGSRSKS